MGTDTLNSPSHPDRCVDVCVCVCVCVCVVCVLCVITVVLENQHGFILSLKVFHF